MGKYLKKFSIESDRVEYEGSNNYLEPYVSYVEGDNSVHYNKFVETRVVAIYNVTSTSEPTKIGYNQYTSAFTEIEIDGVVQPSVVSAYTFDTLGEHTVKYTLSDPTSIGDNTFYNCSGLASVTIPDSVTSIGSAFRYCSGLTSVTIPDSVTSIGESAFYNCSNLTTVTIPSSVTTIGNGAFGHCLCLTTVTIPDSITSISQSAFQYCSGLTSVTIPNSVTSIGWYAFQYCRSLSSITIPSSVTSIGMGAFDGCSGLTSVTIPSGVTSISDGTFNNCLSLTTVTIPSGVTRIGASAFHACEGLTSVTIPNSVTSIDNAAFDACSGLTSVTIPNSVTNIGNSAFNYCSGLTSITIGSGVTSIGDGAFASCSSLTSVTIGNSVTSIGFYAFASCSSLTSITSLAITAPTIDYRTFTDVKTNGTLIVPSESNGYDNWMSSNRYYLGYYNWTKVEQVETKLVVYYDIQNISVPTTIFTNYDSSVKSIEVDGKETISEFSQGNVTYQFGTVGQHIIKFEFNNPTTVGNNAPLLNNLTTVKRVVIPNTFTAISSYAFSYCSGLTSVTIESTTPPTLGSSVFSYTNDCPIYVPSASVEAYKSTSGWNSYVSRIQAIPTT